MRKRTGQIPRADSSAARSFTRTRVRELQRKVNQWLTASRARTPESAIAYLPYKSEKWVPEHRKYLRHTPHGIHHSATVTTNFRSPTGKKWGPAHLQETVPEGARAVSRLSDAFPDFKLLPGIKAKATVVLATKTDHFGKKRQLYPIKELTKYLNELLTFAGVPHIGARFLVWHVGRWCLMEIVADTPRDTGNAQAGWRISPQIRGKGRGWGGVGFRISTTVGYATYLEYGHASYPPQFMMRKAFTQAGSHVRELTNVMLEWWKQQEYTLRNLRFDPNIRAGVVNEDPKIPSFVWQSLVRALKARLPLVDVSEYNSDAALAYRIDDPKDWSDSSEFVEPAERFLAHYESKKVPVYAVDRDLPVGERGLVDVPLIADEGGGYEIFDVPRQTGVTTQRFVRHTTKGLQGEELDKQVNELRKAWGGR